MTFTYSSTDLSTALAKVRLRIGDTDANRPELTDEEVQVYLDRHSDDDLLAAIDCIKLILARYARKPDRSAGGLSGSRSQITQHYRDLLKDLEADIADTTTPFLGGVIASRNREEEGNALLELGDFDVGIHDNTGTNYDSSTDS